MRPGKSGGSVRWALLTVLLIAGRAAPATAAPDFADGFECGNVSAWSQAKGAVAEGGGCGPGHLVLIGDDFSPPPVVGMQAKTLDPLAQLLVNAVSQSRAVGAGRPLRIVLLGAGAAPEELQAVENTISSALNVQFQLVGVVDLPSALRTADVLLVPDQNGVLGVSALAAELEPNLRSFLNVGGVVVVLDGTVDNGGGTVPSETFRILAPGLLAIDDAAPLANCPSVPCNGADPLLPGVGTLLCPSGDHVVSFATDEPWLTFASLGGGVALDRAFVLHRWFGQARSGPLAVDVDYASGAPGSFAGRDVFFQSAAGAPVAECQTLTNGTAVHAVDVGASVSVGWTTQARQLTTVLAAQPLDQVWLREFEQVLVEPATVFVDLPGTVEGATAYRALLDCAAGTSSSPTLIAVSFTGLCVGRSGLFNVIGEAVDADGEVLAFVMRNGVSVSPGDEVTVSGSWLPANLFPTLSVALPDVGGIDLKITLTADGVDYLERGAPVLAASGGGTFSFYSSPGPGSPPFTLLTHEEGVNFFPPGSEWMRSDRRVRGPLLSSLNLALENVLLPRLTATSLGFDGNERLVASWNAVGSVAAAHGGQLTTTWTTDGLLHRWTILFPGGLGLTAPPSPGGNGALYWPTSADGIGLLELRLEEATFLPTYREYRQDVLGTASPPATAHTVRRTVVRPLF